MKAITTEEMVQLQAGSAICGNSWGAWAGREAIISLAGTAGGLIGIAGGPGGVVIGGAIAGKGVSAAINAECQ